MEVIVRGCFSAIAFLLFLRGVYDALFLDRYGHGIVVIVVSVVVWLVALSDPIYEREASR